VLAPIRVIALAKVWDSWTPSKVIVFSWQTFLERLPTSSNLAHREIVLIGEAASCLDYLAAMESENHLFVSCPVASEV
jgi:hypothetical protein